MLLWCLDLKPEAITSDLHEDEGKVKMSGLKSGGQKGIYKIPDGVSGKMTRFSPLHLLYLATNAPDRPFN